MNRQHEQKLNKLGEIVVSLIDDVLEPVRDTRNDCGYHSINDLNEINRLRNALRKIAQYGNHGRSSLHTWKVPSYTTYGVNYTIKQLLDGDLTCTCPSFKYNSGLDADGFCKHQRDVLADNANTTNLTYGLGAQEAHRRLTEIAKEALIG